MITLAKSFARGCFWGNGDLFFLFELVIKLFKQFNDNLPVKQVFDPSILLPICEIRMILERMKQVVALDLAI